MKYAYTSDLIWQIVFNVVGGILTIFVVAGIKYCNYITRARKYRLVFGSDILQPRLYHLIYGPFCLDPLFSTLLSNSYSKLVDFPYIKPVQIRGRQVKNLSSMYPVSSAELRAVKYLSDSFSRNGAANPMLQPDTDVLDRLDFSFISFGSDASNFKTEDVITNPTNNLIKLGACP